MDQSQQGNGKGDGLFKRISDAFQTVWEVTESHIKLLKETCDMRHKIRRIPTPTSVTSASDAYKKFLTEMLLVISILQLHLKLAIQNNNNNNNSAANTKQMEKIIRYLVDAYDVLSKQKEWKGIKPEQIDKAAMEKEWENYIDLLREKLEQLDNMMAVLTECRPYALFETAWQAHEKAWSQVMVDAGEGVPLHEILMKVNQAESPR